MKVGKEEIMGLMAALEIYLRKDFQKENEKWEKKIDYLVSKLSELPCLKAEKLNLMK